jgi:hypothetical protein
MPEPWNTFDETINEMNSDCKLFLQVKIYCTRYLFQFFHATSPTFPTTSPSISEQHYPAIIKYDPFGNLTAIVGNGEYDLLGSSVAMSKNIRTMVVGAPGYDDGQDT